jgi:hypothetical protein
MHNVLMWDEGLKGIREYVYRRVSIPVPTNNKPPNDTAHANGVTYYSTIVNPQSTINIGGRMM